MSTIYTISIGAGSSSMSTVPWLDQGAATPTIEGDLEASSSNTRRVDFERLQALSRSTSLDAVFFDARTGLISKLPGVTALTKAHADAVHKALTDWQVAHPTAKARLNADFAGDYKGVDGALLEEGVLGILTWMDWWMAWALKNCKTPALMVR